MTIQLRAGVSQDESGKWWYTRKNGTRQAAFQATCPVCGTEFVSGTRQRCCSHKCAATEMHGARPVTTPNDCPPDVKHWDNPRFSKDENGQWWYQTKGKRGQAGERTRAHIMVCPGCQQKYLSSIYHRKRQNYCSRSCGVKATHDFGSRSGGNANGRWKGGRFIDSRGYVQLWAPDHPSLEGTKRIYVQEHRLVMENVLGRQLLPNENVHHKDGNRSNNDPSNLELWLKAQPAGQRVEDIVAKAREVLALYDK